MSLPLVEKSEPWTHQQFKSSNVTRNDTGPDSNGDLHDHGVVMMNGDTHGGGNDGTGCHSESTGGGQMGSKPSSQWTISAKSVKGRRRTLEDRYLVIQDFPPNKFDIKVVAAVFDGHGGTEAADFCHDNFQSFFTSALSQTTSNDVTAGNTSNDSSSQRQQPSDDISGQLSPILRSTFLALDEAFCQKYPKSNCGSTALVVAIDSHKSRVEFANVGDSAATVFRLGEESPRVCSDSKPPDLDLHESCESAGAAFEGSEVVLLNDIHNTSNDSEADRIKKSGGFLFSVSGGTKRVNGSLSVTRAIGDVGLKQFVIGDPEVDVYEVEKNRDKFVILASDGFYDAIPYDGDLALVCEQMELKMKDEDIPNSEKPQQENTKRASLAELLCEEASKRNNSDNITVVCISLT